MALPRPRASKMMILIIGVVATFFHTPVLFGQDSKTDEMDTVTQTIYDFQVTDINGDSYDLHQHEGQVMLIVNTASECGFTPQFEGLERLYGDYKDQGLVVLGFPCNQFGGQEPGDEQSIIQGCMVNYGVTFPMFSKVNVNGKDAHPLFQYLKKERPGFPGQSIKWNFTKFLIDREGNIVKRYGSIDTPDKIEKHLPKYL